MTQQKMQVLIKLYLSFLRRKKQAGFTLAELLVAIAISSIVVVGALWLTVNLLETDQREKAKSQTEQEMGQAMDYIATDLAQAVYIYEGKCLKTGGDAASKCPGIATTITFPNNVTPVLAFWKLEPVPYRKDATGTELLPTDCSTFPETAISPNPTQSDCTAIRTSQNSYTLVVYAIRTDAAATPTWKGPAQISRYQLQKYNPEALSTLTPSSGTYVSPLDSKKRFDTWPCDVDGTNCPTQAAYNEGGNNPNARVLVDLVDDPTQGNNPEVCPGKNPDAKGNTDTYSRTADPAIKSFYACVRKPDLTSSGNLQDAIVYLRGNALKAANINPNTRDPLYLPSIQRQVQAKSVFERRPPDF